MEVKLNNKFYLEPAAKISVFRGFAMAANVQDCAKLDTGIIQRRIGAIPVDNLGERSGTEANRQRAVRRMFRTLFFLTPNTVNKKTNYQNKSYKYD